MIARGCATTAGAAGAGTGATGTGSGRETGGVWGTGAGAVAGGWLPAPVNARSKRVAGAADAGCATAGAGGCIAAGCIAAGRTTAFAAAGARVWAKNVRRTMQPTNAPAKYATSIIKAVCSRNANIGFFPSTRDRSGSIGQPC